MIFLVAMTQCLTVQLIQILRFNDRIFLSEFRKELDFEAKPITLILEIHPIGPQASKRGRF